MLEAKADFHRIRARACAIVIFEDQLLVVKVHSPALYKDIWMPPGGEIHFGESIFEASERECEEECNIQVRAHKMLYFNEFISTTNVHALEYYVLCDWVSGTPTLGFDPEHLNEPILSELKLIPLSLLNRASDLHPSFLQTDLVRDLQNPNSFPKFIH